MWKNDVPDLARSAEVQEQARRHGWIEELEQELDYFEWDSLVYGHYDGSNFAVDEEPDAPYGYRMRVSFYALDSSVSGYDLEVGTDAEMQSFVQTTDVDMSITPRQMIRRCIHMWCCHEADEKMFFGKDREQPFFPTHPHSTQEVM